MSLLEMNRSEYIKGIRMREEELKKEYLKYEAACDIPKRDRYDAFYTCYGLFADYLEHPEQTKLGHIEQYILKVKQYLKDSDLNEMRILYNTLAKDIEVLLGQELGARKISESVII